MSKLSEVAHAKQRVVEIMEELVYGDNEAALMAEYNEIVPILLAYHGENGQADDIDPLTNETYHNVYKSEHGVRPRGHTYKMMIDYLDEQRAKSDLEQFGDEPATFVLSDEFLTADETDVMQRLEDYRDVYGVSGFREVEQFTKH